MNLPHVPMSDVEIDTPLALLTEQRNVLEMHSISNVMSVIVTELHLLQRSLGGARVLEPMIDRGCELTRALSKLESRRETLAQMVALEHRVNKEVEPLLEAQPRFRDNKDVKECRENLASVFGVLRVRVDEILDRMSAGDDWRDHDVKLLVDNFRGFLGAVEKNAHGRYRIVTDPGAHDPQTYLVHVDISGVRRDTVFMPPVLQDVLRDLVANARKYTKPGGTIRASLRDDGASIRIVVEDNGRGIPQDQVKEVVGFGCRGRNVGPDETKGNGFGLTKAYEVVRRWGGRMWIATAESRGVRVTLQVPRPARGAARAAGPGARDQPSASHVVVESA